MARLFCGLLIVFVLFQFLGHSLHSDRGQAGILIGAVIVASMLLYERVAYGVPFRDGGLVLGLGRPDARGIWVSCLVSALLLVSLPVWAWFSGEKISLNTERLWYVLGIFAQAGIAEETLFRGFLFGHLRRTRAFWSAALISTIPFALVHLILFITMPASIAIASLVLSIITSFPFSFLYEIGGRTIWAPAILHFVIQGAIKVVDLPNSESRLPLIWIGLCAAVPNLVFIFRTADKPGD